MVNVCSPALRNTSAWEMLVLRSVYRLSSMSSLTVEHVSFAAHCGALPLLLHADML
jgi:hypothetical protein